MKFELRKPLYHFKNMINDYLELYITKTQFVKLFEANKEQCHNEFSTCLEMYTAPCCFECYPELDYVEDLYNAIKSKSNYKGIVFNIAEVHDESDKYKIPRRTLVCALVKK